MSNTLPFKRTSLFIPFQIGDDSLFEACNAKNMSGETPGAGAAPAAATPENTQATPPEGGESPAVPPTNSPEAEANNPNKEGEEGNFEDDGQEPEISKRKTAKDFIIERQRRKIEKLKHSQDSGNDDDQGEDPDDNSDGDTPEDGKDAQLEAMRPLVEQHLADQDAQEVTKFLEGNPDFAPYAGKVERMMKHESRRHIPVDELFFAAAGKHLMKLGADRARKADAEAKDTQSGGGGSSREGLAPIDWSTASKAELEAEQLRIRQGSR